MNAAQLKLAVTSISDVIAENKDYLTKLDGQAGDGDLGISMASGFKAVCEFLATADETDLGKLMMKISTVFNETAPSSLGTIISFGMMGMAQSLKGKEDASLPEFAAAMKVGVDKIMERAGSKPGEKTILDSLCAGVDTLNANAGGDKLAALKAASEAAHEGSESTKQMRSVHGRAAYFGDKSIGLLDGGSVVGYLIFEALYQYASKA